MKKNLALIAFPGDYFYSFALELSKNGFQVYWVCTTRSMYTYLINKLNVNKSFVIDLTTDFRDRSYDISHCRRVLSDLESVSTLRINDIILMDRILRKKPYDTAVKFLYHVQDRLTNFLVDNEISLVNSGRDTAIQMISLLVCKKLDISWVVPTRLRIPKSVYGFCEDYETSEFIKFRDVNKDDRCWAEDFYNEFHNNRIVPEMKKSYYSSETASIFVLQIKIFFQLLKDSIIDMGNDMTRYSIRELCLMFLKRRKNAIIFRYFNVCKLPGEAPYFLYTLHTQPESSIDVQASFYSDQINLIKIISRSIPITHELYVKVHPSDVDGKSRSFYLEIAKIPSVRLLHFSYSTRDLIARAEITFVLTGTVGYESAILGRKVVTFANNFYNKLPSVQYCESLKTLPQLITTLVHDKKPISKEEIICFLAEMKSRCFVGEFNRNYGGMISNLTKKDLSVLGEAYNHLYFLQERNLMGVH